jgi:hypothetical protein
MDSVPRRRRAVATVVARGPGSYVSARHQTQPLRPDYVHTVVPLLCSFSRMGSHLGPMIVFTSNLTATEHDSLRLHGAQVRDLTWYGARQRFRLDRVNTSASCELPGKGGWQVWGRSDFAETMLKLLLWRELAREFDEFLYVDPDSLFLHPPDTLFDTLHPQALGKKGLAHRMLNLRDLRRCGWRKGGAFDYKHRHRKMCPSLDFVAPLSGRGMLSHVFTGTNQTACLRSGWSTSIFLARASTARSQSLLHRARTGNFSTFTRTEQDVLDDEFDTRHQCILKSDREAGEADCVPTAVVGIKESFPFTAVGDIYVLHHRMKAYVTGALGEPLTGGHHAETLLLRNLSASLCQASTLQLQPAPFAPLMGPGHARHMKLLEVASRALAVQPCAVRTTPWERCVGP